MTTDYKAPDLTEMTIRDLLQLVNACMGSREESDIAFMNACQEEIKRRVPEVKLKNQRRAK